MINLKKKVVSGILAFSLFTTSFGGAFAVSAFAATPEAPAAEEAGPSKEVLIGLAAVGLIAMLSNHNDDSTPVAKNPSGQTPSSGTVLSAQEQEALNLLNTDRAKNGLPALKANGQLTKLAETYAKDMINRGFFAHNNPEGQTPFDRMAAAGISYRTAGENLAINTSVAAAENAFMNSSGHRANILNSSYTDVGIGVVKNAKGQVYVVQEFIGK